MLCPICKVELAMTDRQGIEIDYCKSCRGVWLDRGELDKIIERSLQDVQPIPAARQQDRPQRQEPWQAQPDNRYQGQPVHGYQPRKYKKKSLLSELFDF